MSFKTIIILAVLAAPFVYAYREKPLLNDHKIKIYQAASKSDEPLTEEQMALPKWDDLEFVDWGVVTSTRDKAKMSMITFGIVKYIKVVDDDWGPNTLGLKKDEKKEQ